MIEEFDKMVDDALGDSKKNAIPIMLLATHPDFQGCGFGSALMQTLLNIADLQRRDTYLITSTMSNVQFYNGFGFKTVGETVLGKENSNYEDSTVSRAGDSAHDGALSSHLSKCGSH